MVEVVFLLLNLLPYCLEDEPFHEPFVNIVAINCDSNYAPHSDYFVFVDE